MDLLLYNSMANGVLLDRMNGVFSGLASEFERSAPLVDVVEDRDAYRFSVELPGLKSDSLEVKVEDETLVIDAERDEPARAKDAHVHRAERHYGRIHRAFRLPGDVGHDAIKAAYKDGVLDVTIAKRPETKPVTVAVAYSN
jgi:HSP20 family protein